MCNITTNCWKFKTFIISILAMFVFQFYSSFCVKSLTFISFFRRKIHKVLVHYIPVKNANSKNFIFHTTNVNIFISDGLVQKSLCRMCHELVPFILCQWSELPEHVVLWMFLRTKVIIYIQVLQNQFNTVYCSCKICNKCFHGASSLA